MIELEEARLAALASFPVQASAAITATVNKAKLAGIMVERSEVGAPGRFAAARSQEDVFRIIEQRAGPRAVELFRQFLEHLDRLAQIEAKERAVDESDA